MLATDERLAKTRLWAVISVLSNVAGNSALTHGMQELGGVGNTPLALIGALFHPWVALGVAMLIVWTFAHMALLSWADLSYVMPVTAIGYVVTQIVGQNLFAAKTKQIDIRVGVQKDLIVRTDSAAALQILDNLISNAVKYSPKNSTIHVHLVPEKGHALVLVRDEGPGISDEDQKKLFGKYCRLTAQPTGGESSTGLGLSIAKRLAQQLGGDILCRSALGAGTTFTFRLPLQLVDRPESAVGVVDILREQAALVSHRN